MIAEEDGTPSIAAFLSINKRKIEHAIEHLSLLSLIKGGGISELTCLVFLRIQIIIK